MKAILISSIATIITLLIAGLITHFIFRKRVKDGRAKRHLRVITFICISLVIYVAGGMAYFGQYYHATARAKSYLSGTDKVKVNEIDDGYFFDGPGTESAFVFYPGAKVDEVAYAELMSGLAESGVDCFLIKMPLHMAFMGREKASSVMEDYSYKKWYIGGHSLGGAMAAVYASQHSEELDGVALLASYSTEKLSDGLDIVSVVASNDEVLNWEAYDEDRVNLPKDSDEVVIEGGNHGQFGDYGQQAGDGQASISLESQQSQVKDAVLEMIYDY